MLEVQKYLLNGGTLDSIKSDLGITATYHPEDPLVILNYDQIDSPKTHPIVRECRALTLNQYNYDVVARSFNRFFNWGENISEGNQFNFKDFTTSTKEDGSLALVYNWEGRWRFNTRASFGFGETQDPGLTWQQLAARSLGVTDLNNLKLDPNFTYICELTSPFNKVVRTYSQPQMFLISMYDLQDHRELTDQEVDDFYRDSGKPYFQNVDRFYFKSIDEILDYIDTVSQDDPTYEGVIIRDNQNLRFKVKSKTYLALHKMFGNGNIFLPKYQLPFILQAEEGELLAVYPEVKESFMKNKSKVLAALEKTREFWEKTKHIESQKEFALQVKDFELSGLLFQMREQPDQSLEKLFRNSEDLILKKILKG